MTVASKAWKSGEEGPWCVRCGVKKRIMRYVRHGMFQCECGAQAYMLLPTTRPAP